MSNKFQQLVKKYFLPISTFIVLIFLVSFSSPKSSNGRIYALAVLFLVALLGYFCVSYICRLFTKKTTVINALSVIAAIGLASSMGFSSIGQFGIVDGSLLVGALLILAFYIVRIKK